MSHAVQGPQDERVIVKSSDKMWSTGETIPVFLQQELHEQYDSETEQLLIA